MLVGGPGKQGVALWRRGSATASKMVEPCTSYRRTSISTFNSIERRLCRAVNLFAVAIPLLAQSFHVSSTSTSTTTQAQAFAFMTSNRSITTQLTWGVRRPRLPRVSKARSSTITAANRIVGFSLRRRQEGREIRSVLRNSAGKRMEAGVGQQQQEQKQQQQQQPAGEMLLPLLPEGDEVVVDDTPVLNDSQQDELDLLAKELGSERVFRFFVFSSLHILY